MQVEKVKLGEELSIPLKWMQIMNVASGEELTVLYSEAGRYDKWKEKMDRELREKGDLQ